MEQAIAAVHASGNSLADDLSRVLEVGDDRFAPGCLRTIYDRGRLTRDDLVTEIDKEAAGRDFVLLGHGTGNRLNPLDEGYRPGGLSDQEWATTLAARRPRSAHLQTTPRE